MPASDAVLGCAPCWTDPKVCSRLWLHACRPDLASSLPQRITNRVDILGSVVSVRVRQEDSQGRPARVKPDA